MHVTVFCTVLREDFCCDSALQNWTQVLIQYIGKRFVWHLWIDLENKKVWTIKSTKQQIKLKATETRSSRHSKQTEEADERWQVTYVDNILLVLQHWDGLPIIMCMSQDFQPFCEWKTLKSGITSIFHLPIKQESLHVVKKTYLRVNILFCAWGAVSNGVKCLLRLGSLDKD